MDPRAIRARPRPLDAALTAPPSKSMTHRALIAAALAEGRSAILDPLRADDTAATCRGLAALGVGIRCAGERWIVEGRAAAIPGGGELFLGASGTSLRFLLALAALGTVPSSLDGVPRLRERPIGELVGALRELGARIVARDGGLPLRVGGATLRGGRVHVPGGRSSQFASALLLIGPCLPGGLELILDPPRVSLPYVELTARVLSDFGAVVDRPEPGRFRIRQSALSGREYRVEGDHSSASYFLIAACIVGGRVRVVGLDPASLQPDRRVAGILEQAGGRVVSDADWVEVQGTGRVRPFEADLADAPDLGPGLAVLALYAEGPCVLRGVGHLRHKESDRLGLLARNLRALGCAVRIAEDRLEIDPPSSVVGGARIVTGADHRIAMAFAVAGLRTAGTMLDDAACVGKSNPGFWNQLEQL